jgi:hypothetical protein
MDCGAMPFRRSLGWSWSGRTTTTVGRPAWSICTQSCAIGGMGNRAARLATAATPVEMIENEKRADLGVALTRSVQ